MRYDCTLSVPGLNSVDIFFVVQTNKQRYSPNFQMMVPIGKKKRMEFNNFAKND